jgi:hypothetical protein
MLLKKKERENKARNTEESRSERWMDGRDERMALPTRCFVALVAVPWFHYANPRINHCSASSYLYTVYTLNFLCPTIDSCLKGKSSGIAPYPTIEKTILLCKFVN